MSDLTCIPENHPLQSKRMTLVGSPNPDQDPEGPLETVKNLCILAGGITILIALYIAHARISFYLLP